MSQKKTETEDPPASKGAEKPQCHIHDKADERIVDEVRENVCVNDKPLTEFEGKHYCLFHLPAIDKDIAKFEQIFQARLEAIEQKVAAIEKLSEDKQAEAKRGLRYDFRYVWFPSEVNFSNHKLVAAADFSEAIFSAVTSFSSATFTANAYFRDAIFSGVTSFRDATFTADAYFGSATFTADAFFLSSTFSAYADFSWTTFSAFTNFSDAAFTADAYFRDVTFSNDVYFSDAIFSATTSFSWAKFEELSQIFFAQTKFSGTLSFKNTNFKGFMAFRGTQDNRLFVGEKALLGFQNARINDAKKMSFHTVRLEPSWFINTDASEFDFTDCQWRYADKKRLNVKTELQNLKKRRIESSNALLTKTCWQLADNYEASKSFPKASIFRQMANESKRLEEFGGWKIWSLQWWYWVSSFYGERPLQGAFVLAGILSIFAVVYMFTDFQVCPIVKTASENPCGVSRPLFFGEAMIQSLATATFQSIEYIKPSSEVTTFFIVLEKIFAPLQAALLALAIRRKFMR